MTKAEFLRIIKKQSYDLVISSIENCESMNEVWRAYSPAFRKINKEDLREYIKDFINYLEIAKEITESTVISYIKLFYKFIEKTFRNRFFYDFPMSYGKILKEKLNEFGNSIIKEINEQVA